MQKISMENRKNFVFEKIPLLGIVAIIFLGVFLRFYELGQQSVWNDEVYTAQNISMPWRAAMFQPANNHPPLYFLQLRAWQWFSPYPTHTQGGMRFLRLNAACWGALSIIFFFLLARRCIPLPETIVATAFLALSPWHLAFSQDIRPYTMALTLGLVGFLLMDIIAKSKSPATLWMMAGAGALWALELTTHYWGLFVMAGQVFFVITAAPHKNRRLGLLLAAFGALGIFALWWPALKFHLGETAMRRFEMFPSTPADLRKTLAAFLGLQFHFGNQVFRSPVPGSIFWSALVLGAALMSVGIIKGPRLARVWILVGVGVPYAVSFFHPIYLWYRYPFISFGGFILLMAAGLAALPWRSVGRAAAIFLLGIQVVGAWHYFHGWQKGNAKMAFSFVHQAMTDKTILVRPRHLAPLMVYYDLTPTDRLIYEDELDSPEKRRALKNKDLLFIAVDATEDPVGEALIKELSLLPLRQFPAIRLHGITVYGQPNKIFNHQGTNEQGIFKGQIPK